MLCFLLLFAHDQLLSNLRISLYCERDLAEMMRSQLLEVDVGPLLVEKDPILFEFADGSSESVPADFFPEEFKTSGVGPYDSSEPYHKVHQKNGFYFKALSAEDKQPENEMFCYALYKVFGIEQLIAETCLAKMRYANGRTEQWIQISKVAGEQNLEQYLKECEGKKIKPNLDQDACGWHFIMALLLNLGDAKPANYIVSDPDPKAPDAPRNLISIDHEMAFRMPTVYYEDRNHLPGILSTLFLRSFWKKNTISKSIKIPDTVKVKILFFRSAGLIVEKWMEQCNFHNEYKFYTGRSIQALWSLEKRSLFYSANNQFKHFGAVHGSLPQPSLTYFDLLKECEPDLAKYFEKIENTFKEFEELYNTSKEDNIARPFKGEAELKNKKPTLARYFEEVTDEKALPDIWQFIIYKDEKTGLSAKSFFSEMLSDFHLNLLRLSTMMSESPEDLHKCQGCSE